MLILVLKARSLHYLFVNYTTTCCVKESSTSHVCNICWSVQVSGGHPPIYVEYILHPTGLYSQYSCIFRVYHDSTVQHSRTEETTRKNNEELKF